MGCHPHNAKEMDVNYYNKLQALIKNNQDTVVAVGEAGLDYDRMFSEMNQQKRVLSQLQTIAIEQELPMFLHERKAVNDFVKTMKKERQLCMKSVVHCFTGDKNTAYSYLQLGLYIGLTGWICDNRRNKEVLEALKIIPLERILIETDAPYLTPLGYNLDKRNTPDNLKYVINKIAEIKNVNASEVEKVTYENTKKLFNI